MALGDDFSNGVQAVDPGANSTGQGLGDFLAAVAGHPVNRMALNALPVQAALSAQASQAQTQHIGAQTQQALAAAEEAQQNALAAAAKNQARTNFKGSMIANGMDPAEADFRANAAVGDLGTQFNATADATGALQSQKWKAVLADPNAPQAAKFAASQALQSKLENPLMTAPAEGINVSGAPVNTQLDQTGAADITQKHASAAESLAKAAASAQAQGQLTPNDLAYYGHIFHLTGQMPSLGMGGANTRLAIMHAASNEAQGLTNTPDPSYKPSMVAPLEPFNGVNGAPGAAAAPGAPGAQPATPAVSAQAAGDQSVQNAQAQKTTQQTLNSFAKGPPSQQIRAINNLSGHLHTMDSLIDALHNNKPELVNQIGNAWQQQFGTSAAPTNMAVAGPIIGAEVLKMLVQNGVGTGPEREDIANAFTNSHTTTALQGAASTLRQFRDRQVLGLEQSYKAGTTDGINPAGRTDFRQRYLMPDVADELGQNHPDTHITLTPGEAQAVGPDGNVYVSRNGAWTNTGVRAQK